MNKNKDKNAKTYSYKTRKEKIKLTILDDNKPILDGNHQMLDSMDSICKSKGEEAVRRNEYYNSYDLKATDPQGMYTGIPAKEFGEVPVQDVDDL